MQAFATRAETEIEPFHQQLSNLFQCNTKSYQLNLKISIVFRSSNDNNDKLNLVLKRHLGWLYINSFYYPKNQGAKQLTTLVLSSYFIPLCVFSFLDLPSLVRPPIHLNNPNSTTFYEFVISQPNTQDHEDNKFNHDTK